MQQEIVRTLKQIDTEIRELTKCLERATREISMDEQRKCENELGGLKTAMKAHRSQIRAWTSRFGANLPSKDKLGAARSRIEQELRRCQEFEKKLKFATASERVSEKPHVGKDSSVPNEDSICPSLQADHGLVESEVKIMADQLCAEDMEELQMAKEFVCQICFHVVGETPQLSSCSHLFCGDCIAKWIEVQPGSQSWARRASMGGGVPCPICKEPLQKDTDLHAISPDSDGNGAILWQMLCGVKVMCANHSKCNSEGHCNWIGDYGSYQEHIRGCANTPMDQFENNVSNPDDVSHAPPDTSTTSDNEELGDYELDVATTASEISEHVDCESACESEHAGSDSTVGPSVDQGSYSGSCSDIEKPDVETSGSCSDIEKPDVETQRLEEASWSDPVADLMDLSAKEDRVTQENTEETHAAENTECVAAQGPNLNHSKLSIDAAPFEPAKPKPAAKSKHSSKKMPAQKINGFQSLQLQAAALQYQATQVQMAQMAYMHRLRSAQMAQYQAAYVQAHMSYMRSAQRSTR